MMRRLILFTIIILSLGACRKESISEFRDQTQIVPSVLYRFDLRGVVRDELGNPVPGAMVSTEQRTAIADEIGVFEMLDFEAGSKGVYLKVEAAGHFHGGELIYAGGSDNRFVPITIVKHADPGDFFTNGGGAVQIDESSSLRIPPGSLLSETGAYNGRVQVKAVWLHPDSAQLFDRMPGNLSAITREGRLVVLETYGMAAIELYGASGQRLQLHPDRPAELVVQIGQSQLGEAPERMPLWLFDEDRGHWMEEGEAVREGDTYRGQLPHLSWWNFDLPFPSVYRCFQLIDEEGQKWNNVEIRFRAPEYNFQWYGMSNDSGQACGVLAANTELLFSVINECGTWSEEISLGSYDESSADPEDITVEVARDLRYELSGTVFDCAGQPLPGAQVYIRSINDLDLAMVTTDDLGRYSYSGWSCKQITTLQVQALDPGSLLGDLETVRIDIPTPGTLDLNLCDMVGDEYVLYSYRGEVYYYENCTALTTGQRVNISSVSGNHEFFINYDGLGIGEYKATPSGSQLGIFTTNSVDLTITKFGSIGGVIEGNFTGRSTTGELLTGNFLAIRR